MATAPKTKATRGFTLPSRQWPAAAKRLVSPTTARLDAIASLAPKPATYVRIGTARTEPPPPRRPRERPISAASASTGTSTVAASPPAPAASVPLDQPDALPHDNWDAA